MKKSSLFLFVLAFVASQVASARCEQGEYLDLRSIEAKVFKNIEIKDQGQYGICYAYAGATLVDFFRMKQNGGNVNISPLQAGLLGTISAENDDEEGGDICDVVNAISVKGKACSDTSVGRELRYKDIGGYFHQNAVEKVFMPFLLKTETFKSVSSSSFKSREGLSASQRKYLDRFDAFYKLLKVEVKKRGFSDEYIPTPSEVFSVAQKAHADNRYHILGPSFTQLMINKSCKGSSIAIPKLICETTSIQKASPDTMMGEIDHALSSNRPSGISYCSVMLTSNSTNGMDFSGKPKSNCGLHASVIVGRKADSVGRCHYLIRNSWGSNQRYDWPTSQGDVWVSEYQLKRNLNKVHIIQ